MDFKRLKKSTTQDKAHMNRSLHSNPENIGANNHIPKPHITTPPNIINIQIGTVMGSFNPIPSTNFPIPNQFRTTPIGPVLNSPQPFCKFPSSQPFIPNRQDLLYQKFGNCIPNHTSFANDMKPNNPISAQSRENETKESEPHSIGAKTPNESWVKTNPNEKSCTYDPGYEAINLTNSSKLPPSQRVGKGHMPSIAELNDLRRVVTNIGRGLTSIAEQHRMILENHKQLEKSHQMLSEHTMVLHDTMLRQQMQMTRHIFNMTKYMYAFMRMQQASSSTPSQQPFHSTPNSQYANENEDDNEDDAKDGDEHEDKVEDATPLGRH